MEKPKNRESEYLLVPHISAQDLALLMQAFELIKQFEQVLSIQYGDHSIVQEIVTVTGQIPLTQELSFNVSELWVGNGEKQTPLSDRESELLKLFIINEGHIVSKEDIAEKLWGEPYDLGGVSKLIKRLRFKLGVQDLIIGRKQGGYIFKRKL